MRVLVVGGADFLIPALRRALPASDQVAWAEKWVEGSDADAVISRELYLAAARARVIAIASESGETAELRRFLWLGATAMHFAGLFGPGAPDVSSSELARTFIENAAHAIVLAVSQRRAAGRLYRVADWVASLEAWQSAKALVADEGTVALASADQGEFAAIRRELGYRSVVDVSTALRATLEWENGYDAGRGSPGKVGIEVSLAAAAPGRGPQRMKAMNKSTMISSTQMLPSGPTLPPVTQREP